MSRLRLLLLTALVPLALTVGCASAQAKSGDRSSGSRAVKDCKACHRMCEVGGGAKDKADKVAECKKDCDKSCK